MTEPGALWRWHDMVRQQDEHRHETIKAIRRDDPTSALWHIAGPGAVIDYMQATHGAGTTSEPDGASSEPDELQFPHRVVTTIDELLANVSATPAAVALRVTGIDHVGDAVVEAVTDWVGGPTVVATFLGLDSPPAIDRFYVRAALLAETATVVATLRRTADVAADLERLADL